ncbi:DUF3035 domain-containing protein [Sphingomonas parva]|uniref:DUF3035 domain-containing protein n=1 Tax=Sphingomonas parva TaxID=2555898 RepID=A0A4Y8ZLT1_9SPHN|nr:DUF3035 domain-containing protein [Sphingomonas parva]TFI56914.1 DUF3035 domain-containing protein [Sphingomonas parva]
MRKMKIAFAVAAASSVLAACGTGGVLGRDRPDEFAVARNAPLVIPPDFALVPPRPGEPVPQGTDARTQALEALFGGPAPRSDAERQMLNQAGASTAALGARSVAGDPGTTVVDKGAVTRDIVAAPAGAGREANVTTPQ